MNRLFNMDNPFFTTMTKVADLFILTMLFYLCCIPIITIGPALTALFYVTLKMVKNEESYIVRPFFHSFKSNFKQGVIIHLIMVIIAVIFVGDLLIIRQSTASYVPVYKVFLFALMLVYAMIFLYIYPILARFENSVKNTFRNAILMAIRHLPQTVMMLLISAIPVAIILLPGDKIMSLFLMFLILIGPAGIAFVNSTVFVRIFANYIPAETPVTDEDFDPNCIFPDTPDSETESTKE